MVHSYGFVGGYGKSGLPGAGYGGWVYDARIDCASSWEGFLSSDLFDLCGSSLGAAPMLLTRCMAVVDPDSGFSHPLPGCSLLAFDCAYQKILV